MVKEVRDASGKVIYEANPAEHRAVSADVARDVTYALSNVVENGTGRSVQTLSRPVAGKTGTNGVTDAKGNDIVNSAWFVGFTKQISTAVMYVAGDDGNVHLDEYARPGDSTFFGGTYPAMTWADYMQTATKGQPVERLRPAGLRQQGRRARAHSDQRPPQTSEPTDEPTETSEPTRTRSPEPSETSEPTEEPTEEPSETETDRAGHSAVHADDLQRGRPGRGKTPGASG